MFDARQKFDSKEKSILHVTNHKTFEVAWTEKLTHDHRKGTSRERSVCCPLRSISYQMQVLHQDTHPNENWSNDYQAQKL